MEKNANSQEFEHFDQKNRNKLRIKSIVNDSLDNLEQQKINKHNNNNKKLYLFKDLINSQFAYNIEDIINLINQKYIIFIRESQQQNNLEKPDEDDGYDSESDPLSVIIFDNDLYFLKTIKEIDLVLLVDTTGSMNPYLKEIKHFLRKLLCDVRKTVSNLPSEEVEILKVGLVTYRDHDQEKISYVSRVNVDLTSDTSLIRREIMNMTTSGGGDEPEAVLDGINEAINNISWREKSFKFIYHVLDAPAHGKELNGGLKDDYKECPCGINFRDLLYDLKGKGIDYTIVGLGGHLDKMIDAFSTVTKLEVMNPIITIDDTKPNLQK